jgi:hypothetical protein
VGDHPGSADVGDRQLAQLLLVLGQRLVQLVQAPGAERDVSRPAGGVARASATDASGAWSSTWPVAGLTDGYVWSAVTSFPSMSMRCIRFLPYGAGVGLP